MKRFLEVLAAVKSFAGLIFTGLIVVITVFGGFFGLEAISFPLVWQALLVSLTAALLYFVSFTDVVFSKLGRGKRFLLYALPFFALLSVFAVVFSWFPLGDPGAWLLFTGCYLGFFGIVTAVVQLYFHVTGQRYTELMAAYQAKYKGKGEGR